mmetsp:Transcript_12844/g.30180  ORF Transcript_12844/g.30180 Transcript_12844/m.30180 type:complete len:102 (+) Transcript_12844:293-598(+)
MGASLPLNLNLLGTSGLVPRVAGGLGGGWRGGSKRLFVTLAARAHWRATRCAGTLGGARTLALTVAAAIDGQATGATVPNAIFFFFFFVYCSLIVLSQGCS